MMVGEVGAPGTQPLWTRAQLLGTGRRVSTYGRRWGRVRCVLRPGPQSSLPRLSSRAPALEQSYLQPPLPSGAARPPAHPLAAQPWVPGSCCGSPSSRSLRSCRTSADYTSRRLPPPHHVT